MPTDTDRDVLVHDFRVRIGEALVCDHSLLQIRRCFSRALKCEKQMLLLEQRIQRKYARRAARAAAAGGK
jgi:hypothetical protein